MPSYQDIETRLRVVEAKIDFALRAFGVKRVYEHPLMPGQTIVEQKTLLDEYLAMTTAGKTPDDLTNSSANGASSGSDVPATSSIIV